VELLGNHALVEFVWAPTYVLPSGGRLARGAAPLSTTHVPHDRIYLYLVAVLPPTFPYVV
jgi:hypothetical protein